MRDGHTVAFDVRLQRLVEQCLRQVGMAELRQRHSQRLVGAILDPVLRALLDEEHDQLLVAPEECLGVERHAARLKERELIARALRHHLSPLAVEFDERAAQVEQDALDAHAPDYT